MIRSLRAGHRAAFLALAVLLPVTLLLGLSARTPVPRQLSLPGGDIDASEGAGVVVRIAGTALALVVRDSILTIRSAENGVLLPDDVRAGPDVLAYWSVRLVESEADLASAWLLGPMRGGVPVSFVLPVSGGFLTLFSLGHGTVLGSVAVPGGSDGP